MGNVDFESAHSFLQDIVELFNSQIDTSLCNVSNTIIYKIEKDTPINLYQVALLYNNYKHVRFECELFPSLSIHIWNPVHVNIFASGKVVILGRDSIMYIHEIISWINKNIL